MHAVLLLLVLALPIASADNKADQLIVNKSKRELLLLKGGKVVKSYHIALGRNPIGPKARRATANAGRRGRDQRPQCGQRISQVATHLISKRG